MVCSKCDADGAVRAHRKSRMDFVAGAFNVLPFYCGACGHRFRRLLFEREVPDPRKRGRWRVRFLYLGGLAVFLVFLHFLTGSSY
jgi:hypothetical protein